MMQAVESSMGTIHIQNISHGAAGLFRCEVSAEAPAFKTVYGERELRVVSEYYFISKSELIFNQY